MAFLELTGVQKRFGDVAALMKAIALAPIP